jgi:hypothetical protein
VVGTLDFWDLGTGSWDGTKIPVPVPNPSFFEDNCMQATNENNFIKIIVDTDYKPEEVEQLIKTVNSDNSHLFEEIDNLKLELEKNNE